MKKPPSKVAHNWPKIYFFSIANRPKTSPNLNFCSIKIARLIKTLAQPKNHESHGPTFLTTGFIARLLYSLQTWL